MIPVSECRQYLPVDWSDDEVTEFRDSLKNFLGWVLDIVEKSY